MVNRNVVGFYNLFIIPLDKYELNSEKIEEFDVSIFTSLSFKPPSHGILTAADIQFVIENHPCKDNRILTAEILDDNSRVVAEISLKRESKTFKNNLQQYLLGTDNISFTSREIRADPQQHDSSYDQLLPQDHIDTAELYYRSVVPRNWLGIIKENSNWKSFENLERNKSHGTSTQGDFIPHHRIRQSLGLSLSAGDQILFNKSISDEEYANYGAMAKRIYNDAAETIQKSLFRYRDLISGVPPENNRRGVLNANNKAVTEDELQEKINDKDINTLLTAASKEPLLASTLGITTKWRMEITAGEAPIPNQLYFICLKPSSLVKETDKVLVETSPTAFAAKNGIVAPRSQNGNSKTHGLSWLNDGKVPRYRTSLSNIDSLITDTFIQQQSNRDLSEDPEPPVEPPPPVDRFYSIVSDTPGDERPAELFEANDYDMPDKEPSKRLQGVGVTQSTSYGIGFHSPVDELVLPNPTGNTLCRGQRALFAEHLQQGNRISVAMLPLNSESQERNLIYRSIHSVNVSYTLKNVVGGVKIIKGETEDYIDKEQLSFEGLRSGEEIQKSTARYLETTFAYWQGFGTAQSPPIRGISQPVNIKDIDYPFTKQVTVVKGSQQSLRYLRDYKYFNRLVYQGGISLTTQQSTAALEKMSDSNRNIFMQDFSYRRTDAFKPGEIIVPNVSIDSGNSDGSELNVRLKSLSDYRTILIAPSPIDMHQARFHGILGNDPNEVKKYKDYYIAMDLRRFYSKHKKLKPYFVDPDVGSIKIDIVSRSRNSDEPSVSFAVNGEACEIFPHQHIASEICHFGRKGDWKTFKPIEIQFCATKSSHVKLKSKKNSMKIWIPKGDSIDLFITPNLTTTELQEHSFIKDIQAWQVELDSRLSSNHTDDTDELKIRALGRFDLLRNTLSIENPSVALTSCITEQLNIRATHSIKKPSTSPTVRTLEVRRKTTESSLGYVHAVVDVDSRTSDSAIFKFRWKTLVDNISQPAPVEVEGGDETIARSIRFEEVSDTLPDSVVNKLDYDARRSIQCAETILVYGGDPENSEVDLLRFNALDQTVTATPENVFGKTAKLERLPTSHVKLRGVVNITTRFKSDFPDLKAADSTLDSEIVEIDLLSIVSLPAPKISHVVPQISRAERVSESGRTFQVDSYSLRIYVDRPWCVGGGDDRLAIACSTNISGISNTNFVTQWGEDVFERPKLQSTKRRPRASDFTVPSSESDTFDVVGVSYFDDVPFTVPPKLPASGQQINEEILNLDLASFSLNYDEKLQLWFTEVSIQDNFYGWLNLALYRHQPYSIPGKYLSIEPTVMNVAKLQNEIVSFGMDRDFLKVTVGPVLDKTVKFDVVQIKELSKSVVMNLSDGIPLKNVPSDEGVLFTLTLKVEPNSNWILRRIKVDAVQNVISMF